MQLILLLLTVLVAKSTTDSSYELLTQTKSIGFIWDGGGPVCNSSRCNENTLYAPSFACSGGLNPGNWSAGRRHFDDPLPQGSDLAGISITLGGHFNVDFGNQAATVTVIVNGEVIGQGRLPSSIPPPVCFNCGSNYTFEKHFQDGWSGYNHEKQNAVEIIVRSNVICLSVVGVTLEYSVDDQGSMMFIVAIFFPCCVVIVGFFLCLIKKSGKKKNDGYQLLAEGYDIDFQHVAMHERIGKGNFGEVFRATWRGVEIAVKTLPVHGIHKDALKDFHKELAFIKALRHPNVLQFLGSCTNPPDVCIITEFMSRGSLYSILHDVEISLDWALLRQILLDACRGMLYLHSLLPVVVHRDMKSHNLLVDENWKSKVCDFGLSTTVMLQVSQTMTACGTPSWTAPEILRNQRYKESADVYSFGIVLWECATREDPYNGMPPFQIIYAVATDGIRPAIPAAVPSHYANLITDCWNEVADQRPSFKEILERLLDFETSGVPYDVEAKISISGNNTD